MVKCEVRGNHYDLSFEVITAEVSRVFDGFGCAIHALAPVCERWTALSFVVPTALGRSGRVGCATASDEG